jgi:hypothetical protein
MDVPPILVNGRVFLPARYVVEAFGFIVDWDGSAVTIRRGDVLDIESMRKTINNTNYLEVGEILKEVGVDNFIIQGNQLSINGNTAILSEDKTMLLLRLKNGMNLDIQLSVIVEGDQWLVSEDDLAKIILTGKMLHSR